jgi:hypothetical protein
MIGRGRRPELASDNSSYPPAKIAGKRKPATWHGSRPYRRRFSWRFLEAVVNDKVLYHSLRQLARGERSGAAVQNGSHAAT